jgi:phosphate transport system permease protein
MVRFTDSVARSVITFGGVGTIVAVSTVCVFLVFVVLPLFEGAEVEKRPSFDAPWPDGAPREMGIDEYEVVGWALMPDATVQIFRLDDGTGLATRKLVGDPAVTVTASSFLPAKQQIVLGLSDGTVRVGTFEFETSYYEADAVPDEIRELEVGASAPYKHGVVEKTPLGQYRLQQLKTDLIDVDALASESPVVAISFVSTDLDVAFALLRKSGALSAHRMEKKVSMLTGATRYVPTKTMPLELPKDRGLPSRVLVSDLGVDVYAAWDDGHTLRYNVRDVDQAVPSETLDLVPEPGRTLTALRFLIGRFTLIAGDSAGTLRAWFPAEDPAGESSGNLDNRSLRMAHRFDREDATAVTTIGPSSRSRLFAAGFENGTARLYFTTSEKLLSAVDPDNAASIHNAVISPKDNGLVIAAENGVWRYRFDEGYPEATMTSLFLKVHYEGYAEPTWKWQSSSGHKGYEMKLSLIPLILGTIKATLYSILFGAPIALLAAMNTSEFLHPRTKSRIKPTIELMATLPSVVLGFVAALVFAPIIERHVPETLTAFYVIPVTILLGAFAWQTVPRPVTIRLGNRRLLMVLPMLALGILLSLWLGPHVERWFFAGDIMTWLDDPTVGTGTGAWMFILLPLCALIAMAVVGHVVNPWLRSAGQKWDRTVYALVDFAKFVCALVIVALVAWGLAAFLVALGWDPRTGWHVAGVDLSPFGTYVQRNALVVGFVMGFAVIPIIYTIAEDALSAVPEHLRSASLAAGATRWQTAVRIIIPTAMSGLFSALMIGLGRAVGETMIVLMAAGNTPVLEMSIFNGFRTLSANIATELPESVRNSTHYRTLFLCALALFVMTFVINTAAEMVRLRFRKKAMEL